MTDIIQKKGQTSAAQIIGSPDRLLEIAVSNNADIEKLERLMALKERYDAEEARKAFYAAISEFQGIVPTIKKTQNVSYTSRKTNQQTDYNFAPLGSIVEQIKSPLHACGLSYRFEQKMERGIEITCIVTHFHGHSERTTMLAPADQSGNKNSIQAIGSTVTYLQRYSLISALGIATADQDIDAQVDISTDQSKNVQDDIQKLEKAETLPELMSTWAQVYKKNRGNQSIPRLTEVYQERKSRLSDNPQIEAQTERTESVQAG